MKRIALVSHLDTVFSPDEEEKNHFQWRPDEHHPRYGRVIYGPGTIDIKGGTAMMWLTLKTLQAQKPDVFDAVTWQLFLNSSEEVLADDFPAVWGKYLNKRNTLAGLVFEAETRRPLAPGADHAGRSRLVVARKGRAEWRVTVEGRGAHPGVDHPSGANAIVQLSRVADRIAAMTNYDKNLTFNIGTIKGGAAMNRVPWLAVATGEVRAFSPEILEEALSALRRLEGKGDVASPKDGWTCSIQVEVANKAPAWPQNESIGLFDIWRKAGETLGCPLEPEARGGISDGNVLSQTAPTLDGLGPWGMNDHCSEQSDDRTKEQEFVFPDSFLPKATLNVLAISDLVESASKNAETMPE
jgi:glutamate carboxypeptidase